MFKIRYKRVFGRCLVVEIKWSKSNECKPGVVAKSESYSLVVDSNQSCDYPMVTRWSLLLTPDKDQKCAYWFKSPSDREEWITNIVLLIDKISTDKPPITLVCYNAGPTGLAIQITHVDEPLRGIGILGEYDGYQIRSYEKPQMFDNELFVWGRMREKDDIVAFHDFETTEEREKWKKAMETIINGIARDSK